MKASMEQRTQEESKNAFERSREELQRIQQNTEFITGNYINTSSHDITQAGLILEIVACLLGSLMDFTNREINMHHRTALCISEQQTCQIGGIDFRHWTLDQELAGRLLCMRTVCTLSFSELYIVSIHLKENYCLNVC